jgi:hypothetical protein
MSAVGPPLTRRLVPDSNSPACTTGVY